MDTPATNWGHFGIQLLALLQEIPIGGSAPLASWDLTGLTSDEVVEHHDRQCRSR